MAERARILIIDDEEIVLDSCREILAGDDYAVSTAADGAQGLARAADFRPDVVFVDLKMPGLSGFEVLERLRATDPAVVPIVITGYATLGYAVEAMQKGAYDFVPKPFTPEEFRLITRRGVEKRRLVQETIALRREQEMLRENFAAIVAHEVKSPLAAVQQNLLLLAGELGPTLTPAQRERLTRLQTRLDDLLKMVDTWLRAIAADLGKIRDRFAPVNLAVVVARAIEAVQPLAARKDVTITAALPETLPAVRGDEGTLAEALTNVLSNAVKYSHAGGQVAITADAVPGAGRVAVRDNGVGISSEDLPFVFSDFYRGRAPAGGETGAGLGLAVTRRIVEVHGGTITAESVPGQGSTFVITIPALPTERTGAAPPAQIQTAASLGGAA